VSEPTPEFVPLVDLRGWYEGDDAARAALAAEVDRAARTSGFLLVVNHGVPEELRLQFRAVLDEFFALPTGVKERYATTVGGHGWTPIGSEANGYSEGTATPPDLKEGFNFGHGSVPPGQEGFPDLFPANQWPAELPELEIAGTAWAAEMRRLKDDLLDLFAAALGLPDGGLRQYNDRPLWLQSCNLYPGAEVTGEPQPGQYRIGPHTDFGVLTILDRQPGMGGLQVQRADGDWVDAPFVAGALTINLGDLSVRWTGGRWRSARHRVLPPPAVDRGERLMSLVFFNEGNPDALVAPLRGIGDPESFEPVRGGDHLRRQLAAITVGG
jgi:isopenicillin N synthase-like dioxygenase